MFRTSCEMLGGGGGGGNLGDSMGFFVGQGKVISRFYHLFHFWERSEIVLWEMT